MVEIISKRGGSDSRDHEIKRFLGQNRQTIDRLANHLTQGAWSIRNTAPSEPKRERQSRSGFTPASNESEVEPRVRISPNDRVVLIDAATSRQIAFIGMIRGARTDRRFILATKENGFIAPLDQGLAALLCGLDGVALNGPDGEDDLAKTITVNLGLSIAADNGSESGD